MRATKSDTEENEKQIDDLVRLSFFSNVGKSIADTTTLNETLRAIMQQIGEIFAPTHWSLLLRNPKTGELRFSVVVGSGVDRLRGVVLPRNTGVAGWVAENGEPLIIEDVTRDSRFTDQMDRVTGFKTRSIIAVPVKNRKKVIGVIELINKIDGTAFTPLELKLLTTIADFGAIAVSRAYYVRALRMLAMSDELTGLNNRRAFLGFLEKEIERFKRSHQPFCVMMIDLDGFKKINDTHGHRIGDEILKATGAMLRSSVRSADVVSRYGGDEFMVLMPGATEQAAEHLKERIEQRVTEYNKKTVVKIALSIGIHQADSERVDELLDLVDSSMYREKARRMEASIGDVAENIESALLDEERTT
ncbi:MAG TPA: sensor domain-containing diguanylate cyclase [Spirochaetia bacterium]|nr:sensor domain-containing diguanylate cyclase [Spirochaetia bacterium]